MNRVLILTASYGDGHDAVARSLRDAFGIVAPNTEAEVLDLFDVAYPTLNTFMKRGYRSLVRYARLIESLAAGAVAKRPHEIPEMVALAFANGGRQWQPWKDNLARTSQPGSALRIAEEALTTAKLELPG